MKIDKIIKKLESLEHQLSEIDKINSTTPLWLTIDQLSDYIHLSISSIRKLVSKDKIPYQRAGTTNKLLFNRKKIDYWLLTGDKSPKKRARKLAKEFIQ